MRLRKTKQSNACIVLYCIMRPYTEAQLDRYRIGIPRENPKSALNFG